MSPTVSAAGAIPPPARPRQAHDGTQAAVELVHTPRAARGRSSGGAGRAVHPRALRQGDPVNRNAFLGLGLTAVLGTALLTAACNKADQASTPGASAPLIGVDYPRSDTDFWNSYIKYVPQSAKE